MRIVQASELRRSLSRLLDEIERGTCETRHRDAVDAMVAFWQAWIEQQRSITKSEMGVY